MGHDTSFELDDPRTVVSYQSYEAALAAVAKLVDAGVPENKLNVVGLDLQTVKKDGMSWGKVILTGVLSGLMWGLLLSVLLWIFMPGRPLWLMITYGLGFGVVYGVLAQTVQYLMTHTSRFGPPNQAVATRFEVKAEAAFADQAIRAISPEFDEYEYVPEVVVPQGPSAPEPPRRVAVDDVKWLEEGMTPPIDPQHMPYLADLPTEVMQLPLLPDPDKSTWFDSPVDDDDDLVNTTSSLRPIID